MGRPYKSELEAMKDTYEFINSLDVTKLYPFFKNNCSYPLLIIGSGGSFAVAKIFELCYKGYGGFAKAITPYELKDETTILGNSKVLIVTAGGNNPDTVGVYNYVRLYEPFELCVICMSKNSKIARAVSENKDAVLFETSIPFGKDGYLAVNSSIAMFTIVKKIMEELENNTTRTIDFDTRDEVLPFLAQTESISNFVVLYGGWGTPAAYDFESKCSEAGLMSLQFVDYRNFAHGRHNWLDKNRDSTMIVALITPQDKMICNKTLQKLPEYLPRVLLGTENKGSIAALELLIKVFYAVDYLGERKGIDPGRPHVPEFGSKLYNIRYNLINNDRYLKKIMQSAKEACIYRKMKTIPYEQTWYDYYSDMYDSFIERLHKEKYKALLLDYDGTIYRADENRIPELISNKLIELLKHNIVIGFATGRGDSIIAMLQKTIPERYWGNVIIGYYNGSYISNLAEDPKFQEVISDKLKEFYDVVNNALPLGEKLVNKGSQLSIREVDSVKLKFYFELLSEIKMNCGFEQIQIYMSGHAIDVIANDYGKQKVFDYLRSICDANILCIGDEGRLYENDFELLACNSGISVDHQNWLGESGWNLAPLGVTNVRATEFYFDKINILEDSFTLEKIE